MKISFEIRRLARLAMIMMISITSHLAFMPLSPAQSLFQIDMEKEAIKYVKKKRNHGLVIALIRGDAVEIKGFGQLSKVEEDSPDENTVFEIGEITQVFTTTLMMLESQSGIFHVDNCINDFLPEDIRVPGYQPFICRVVEEPNLVISSESDYSRMICERDPLAPMHCISFCDLASHTSGLPKMPKGIHGTNPLTFLKRHPTLYRDFSRKAFYESLYKNELNLMPGSLYAYSEGGMALLGNLLADLNESSYEKLVSTSILEPLEMHATGLMLTEEQERLFATGHGKNGKPVEHWYLDAMAPSAGFRSSAADLVKFVKANLKPPNKKLENAWIQTHQSRIDLPKKKINRTTWGGYGWLISNLSEISNHPVIWIDGHTAGFSSFVGFSKDMEIGAVLLSNSRGAVSELGFFILQQLNADQVFNTTHKVQSGQ